MTLLRIRRLRVDADNWFLLGTFWAMFAQEPVLNASEKARCKAEAWQAIARGHEYSDAFERWTKRWAKTSDWRTRRAIRREIAF